MADTEQITVRGRNEDEIATVRRVKDLAASRGITIKEAAFLIIEQGLARVEGGAPDTPDEPPREVPAAKPPIGNKEVLVTEADELAMLKRFRSDAVRLLALGPAEFELLERFADEREVTVEMAAPEIIEQGLACASGESLVIRCENENDARMVERIRQESVEVLELIASQLDRNDFVYLPDDVEEILRAYESHPDWFGDDTIRALCSFIEDNGLRENFGHYLAQYAINMRLDPKLAPREATND